MGKEQSENTGIYGNLKENFTVVLIAFSLSTNCEVQRTIPENCSKM